MECNKDEAIKTKTIADKKFAEKDYAGAKNFTLKAQTLYPPLDGVYQMLMILNVYISSEKKDWYGVLDVNPSDDDETIWKQYKKLVLMLHPDIYKSVGADGAFKIVSEAWSLLSDKDKRSAYNRSREFREKVSCQSSSKRSGPEKDSFWTVCHRCRMHYEYEKVYINRTLLCSNCHNPFDAVEMATPINASKPPAHPLHPNAGPSEPSTRTEEVSDRGKRQREEVRYDLLRRKVMGFL